MNNILLAIQRNVVQWPEQLELIHPTPKAAQFLSTEGHAAHGLHIGSSMRSASHPHQNKKPLSWSGFRFRVGLRDYSLMLEGNP